MRRGATFLLVAVVAAVLAVGTAGVPAVQSTAPGRSQLEKSLAELINQTRAERGLRTLRRSPALERAAASHARAMARLGFFAHESANGTSPFERIRRHYRGSSVGETLLWRSPDVTPEEALALWLQSPPHRRVLLGSAFRVVGLAAVHVEGAPGDFNGLDVTIVVADFGAP